METVEYVIGLIAVIALAGVGALVGFVRPRRRRRNLPPRPGQQAGLKGDWRDGEEHLPGVGDDAEVPRDSATRTVEDVGLPDGPVVERPAPVLGRLVRLRERLARSNSALGQGLLALLSRTRSTRPPGRRSRTPSCSPTSASTPRRASSTPCASA